MQSYFLKPFSFFSLPLLKYLFLGSFTFFSHAEAHLRCSGLSEDGNRPITVMVEEVGAAGSVRITEGSRLRQLGSNVLGFATSKGKQYFLKDVFELYVPFEGEGGQLTIASIEGSESSQFLNLKCDLNWSCHGLGNSCQSSSDCCGGYCAFTNIWDSEEKVCR